MEFDTEDQVLSLIGLSDNNVKSKGAKGEGGALVKGKLIIEEAIIKKK